MNESQEFNSLAENEVWSFKFGIQYITKAQNIGKNRVRSGKQITSEKPTKAVV